MIVVFFTVYIASCLVGGAKLFSGIFDLTYINALLISSVVIIGYACIGGFMAISWADLLQGTLMLVAIVVVPIMMLFDMHGNVDVWQTLKYNECCLNPFYDTTFIGILSSLAWGLGYFGQPHIISKYMAIKDPKGLPLSRLICTSWMSLAMFGAVCVGTIGGIFFMDKELNITENILIVSAFLLTHPIIFGFILTAILAAIMSTINGQLIICSSLIVEDFYKGFIKKDATQKQLILASRISIAIVTIIALSIATDSNSSILMLVAHAWSGLGASLGPIVLFALYSKNVTKNAAIGGVLSGGLGSIFFVFVPIFPYELLPAFMLSVATIVFIKKGK
jgi:sodium/proline symporter